MTTISSHFKTSGIAVHVLILNFLNYSFVLDETKGPVQAPGGVKKGKSTDYHWLYQSTRSTQQLAG